MRIAQISTMSTPVGPTHSGSIEASVWLLTRELTRLGHEVTVFGAGGSRVDGRLVATLPGPYGRGGSPDDWRLCEWINLCRAVEESGQFDILHSHAYLWSLPLSPLSHAPIVHTTHVLPGEDEEKMRKKWPDERVTAISRFQWSAFPQLPPSPVIYHAVDETHFRFMAQPDDYMIFLGRFTPGKGSLAAIEAARKVGVRLLMAGPQSSYYRERVAPLVDGTFVVYAGSVTGEERAALLGRARALIYPISEPEPFGLVMPEAMMCGTPVVAVGLGAVPEIVDDGVTGCVVAAPGDLPAAIERAFNLPRGLVRAQAEKRFSGERMAREYLELYERVISERGAR